MTSGLSELGSSLGSLTRPSSEPTLIAQAVEEFQPMVDAPGQPEQIRIPRHRLYYIVWSVLFGVALGGGGSVFSGTLPPEPTTRALIIGPFVALILALNKMVLLRRFSVTFMLVIASIIGVWTFYLGPPNPYKPMFILMGFAFDLGTLFRTKTLRWRHLALGYVTYACVGASIFLLTLYLIDPGVVLPVRNVIVYALLIFWGIAFPVSYVVYKMIPVDNPPRLVQEIRHQVRPTDAR